MLNRNFEEPALEIVAQFSREKHSTLDIRHSVLVSVGANV